LLPNNYICDSKIGKNCKIHSSIIEQSNIKNNVSIGPFSRLRPNCEIGEGCKIGNFVEIKNSKLGNSTKVSHLAYVGDSEIGNDCNIGCGVIFANYNGKIKNKIKVGNHVFVGSNSNLIAPVTISDNSYICAGTTVTKDVEADDFVIGRVRQENKPNRANKYF
jgi:bifunctional UDP-N-acetylglucosamine pyrophosphorylase/glucosamine-1-phosphate N-acetyltransferase